MKLILLFSVFFSLYADESFITIDEYADQLYHNPRGIGCHLCHGESGEGMLIARYQDKNRKMKLTGAKINELDYKTFADSFTKRINGMPNYYLTNAEIRALYYYLHPKERKNDKK